MKPFDKGALFVGVVIGLVLGTIFGASIMNTKWEHHAVKAGAGEYECDPKGKLTWKWNTQPGDK